jgi:hypothetical protein
MDLVGAKYVFSGRATCGVMMPAGDVRRSLDMMKANAPTPFRMAIELSIDHGKDREIRQARPET